MKDKHIEINELISKYHKEGTLDKNLISDKYHTIGELYKHRIHLFIALMKAKIQLNKGNGDLVDRIIKSKKHFDGSEFEGWFIIQYNRCCYDGSKIWYDNQISYHLPNEYWDKCKFIQTVEKANEWDLHNSDDVLDRLLLI